MERISIFNYEAFYLDYLEGNLSEADTAMLLQFLEEHPECRIENDELMVLDDTEPMTFSGKQSLKQVDETEAIAADNVEHFMIADAEGLLDEEKQSELEAFVAEDAALEATRKRYASVYFAPDASVVFTGKAGLKQRKTLVLWPYVSGAVAAAAAVIAFVFFTNVSADSANPMNIAWEAPAVPQTETNNGTENQALPIETADDNNYASDNDVQFAGATPKIKEERDIVFDKMPVRTEGIHTSVFERMELVPVNTSRGNAIAQNPVETISGDPLLGANPKDEDLAQMTNPIAPVTKFINNNTETKVDFGKRKASKSKKGGFFVKIGKFELSKNKH